MCIQFFLYFRWVKCSEYTEFYILICIIFWIKDIAHKVNMLFYNLSKLKIYYWIDIGTAYLLIDFNVQRNKMAKLYELELTWLTGYFI